MSGPTQRLPFLTAAEEACLRPGPSGRVGGVASASDFFTFFLRDSSEFAASFHESLGDRVYKEWPWEQDGQKQYEGSLRKVQFVSPVRNAPELSSETPVEEEQRWFFRGHGNATLEIRRKLPKLRDGDRFVVAVRWVMTFDGFGCNLRIFCGTLFFKSSAYAKEIREGCIRGYSQSSKRWVAQAEKYAKKHDAIHLRPKPWSEDGADGDGRGEGEEEQGQEQERVKRDPSDLLGDMGPVGGGLKKSGRVSVMEAMRSSVGSSNSIQLSKCHDFLGEYIYLTKEIKRVIQGEAAGDLVLEEDLSTGGGGVPIGGGGLAEAHLDSGAGGGSAHIEDIEDSTVISAAMSHMSIESARTGSWSGSAVGGLGYVDYPAGIPPKQWGRIQDRTVRWLMRSGTASNVPNGHHNHNDIHERAMSVISGNMSVLSGSTFSTGGGRVHRSGRVSMGAPGSPTSVSRHRGGDASPSASSAREEDVVHAKWLEQLRVMSQREQDMRAERLKTAEESEDADDANQTEESNKGADNEGTTDAGDLEGSTKGGGDKQDNEPSAEAGSPPIEEPIVGQPAAGSGEKPYTVVFRGRRLGIQLRELHGIPVVGGLQGYDPDGRGDERGEDGEDEDGEEEVVEGLHVEVSPETNAFDEFPLARLGTASSKCQADDLQTIYGGSAGRSGVATETSSLLDSQSDYQEYVKCILQCKQLFGEGVKKLWRWRPTTLMIGEESPDASVVLEGFMKGLSIRLGLGGEHGAGLRVSYLDMDVGGGDGEYVSLDLEAWEDFMESRFKRLSVTIDPAVLSRPPGASDGPKPSEESKMPTSTPEKGSGAAGPEHSQGAGNKARDVHGSVDFRKTGSAAVPETKIEAPSGVSTGERGGEEVVADAAVERDEAGAASRGKGGDDGNGSGDDEDDEDDDGLETRSRLKFYTPEARSEAEEGEGGNGDSGESMESDGMRVRQPIGVSAMDVTRELGPASDGPSSLTEATSGMLSRVVASHGVEDNEGLMVKTSELRGALSGTMFAGRDAEDRTSSLAGEDAPSPRGSTGGQDFGSPTSRDGSVGAPWSPQEGRGADEGGEGGMGRFEGSRRAGSRLSGKKGIGGAGELGRASSEVRGRTGRELDSEDTVTADASAPSTVDTTGRGEGKAARRPCVGSVLVSVNGVRTQGLSFANVVDLLHTRERPIILEYIDSWDTIFHQHHMETQVREKISRETFEQKLGHPLASKLRKKIEEWMSAFRDQNLRAMVAETQAEDEDSDQGAMKSQGPAVMLWSLIRWLEQELPDVGIFNNNHRAGGGLPVMGELQWKDVKQHLERHIFEQVFDRCLTSAPDYGAGDEELTAKLASLRFLLPRHWCVDSLKDSDSARSYGREWELAQGELCRLVEYRCPLDMLDCVKACVRLVALSVEASLARRQRELEEAAALAASAAQGSGSRSGGSVSSRSGKAQRVTFGADDLLAALTWVVVQANPPRLASRLWFTSYYMREGVEGLGEGAYCLTQLSSALEFAKHVDASVLADIGEDELNRGLEVHEATQNMIKAAAEGHSLKKLGTWDWEPFRGTLLASESVSFWLGAGADPNGLSNDQQATALTAAVSYRRRAVLKILLEGAGSGRVDPNTRICPNFGLQRGWTALMVAALMGDMETILALLRMAGVDRRLVCAHGKDAFDYAVQHGHMDVASVLLADPSKATLCQAAKAGNLAYVKALLLQGQDPNELDSTGQYTPVLAAAFLGHIEVLDALLACPVTDPDRPNVRGETALMYCSQREGYATNDSQVAAAVHLLAKGANRHVRDNDGRSAVEWATHFGSTRLMNVLIHDPSKEKIFVRARERDVQGAMALMEQGVDPNTKCPERDYTPLIAAVFNQDEDMASMLLSNQKTDVNSPGRHGMTPLMYSAQAGHEGMAVLLLRLRADRYRCNDKSETALEIAAIRGHMTVVNVIKYDPERLSICSAAANDDGPAIDGLLRQGVSVNSRHRIRTVRGWHHERYTPLIASCHQGHLSMAKRLLNAGADPNLPNLLGQTPLMYAAGFGGEELILELLRALKSGERKALDSQGRTALRFAEAAGHDEVACILRVDPAVCTIQEAAAAGRVSEVWALMRQGVSGNEARLTVMSRLFESARATSASSVMARGNQYRSNFEPNEYMLTPLAAAAIFGNHRVVEALLADRSVKVDKRDPLGRTALMQAARFGSESCVLLLLKHGASRFKRDRSRKTASDHAIHAGNLGIAGIISADPAKVDLMEIASQGRLVLLKGLVKQNVGLNYIERATPHNTPLIVASANGRDECVRVILQCPGVQVNKANAKGETALMYAAASGSLKIVRMLLQHGADPELRDRRQRHVEHWAYKRGHLNMVLVKVLVWLTGPLHN